MAAKQQPQCQPLSMLPTLGQHIDGMLEADQEQYATLLEAKPKPHMLDNETVDRVTRAFKTQRDDLALFDEQLRRWGAEPKITTEQRMEVIRLKKQMATLRQVNIDVLKLAEELRKGTIENILAMDDAELGLRFLLGDLPGRDKKRG
jgi:hypothetical protein